MAPPGPRRGEIWYAHTPGQPDDPHQPRPALVISEDVRNRASDDVIVVPIFSVGGLGPTRVALRAGTGGIPHESVAFCEEITTIDRDFLAHGPLGPPVPEPVLRSAIRAVRRALGDVLPEPWRGPRTPTSRHDNATLPMRLAHGQWHHDRTMSTPDQPFQDAARRRALHDAIAALDPDGPPALRLLHRPTPTALSGQPLPTSHFPLPPPLSPPPSAPAPFPLHPSPSVIALLPGSFDPFTRAHAALARAALETPPGPIQDPKPSIQNRPYLLLTLSQRTVDKGETHVGSLEDRALLLQHWAQSQRPSALSRRLAVALCNRGLYVEQARAARHLFPPPTQLVFVVGYDKLVQILDPRYYDRREAALAELFTLASLWVAPRGAGEPQAVANLLALPENRPYASAIHLLAVPSAFAHLSATKARAALQAGRLPHKLLPAATLRFIRETGTYLPKPGSATSPAAILPPLPALGEGIRG